MTLNQRLGSAANQTIQLHCLVLDGRLPDAGPVLRAAVTGYAWRGQTP